MSFVVKKEKTPPRNKKDSQNGRFAFTKTPAIVPWCNGSTALFDSVSLGSNPSGTTISFTG
jgi:hypothetical protein